MCDRFQKGIATVLGVFIRHVLTHAEYDKGKWKSNCHSD